MLKKMFICILLSMFFWGCSQVPKPTSHPFSTQKKIQAGDHWNMFAKDIGQTVVKEIKKEGYGNSISLTPNNNSSFCRAFRSFLSTYFIHSGIDIKKEETSDYQLDWAVQGITHKDSRTSSHLPGSNTLIASLGYGVYKLFDNSSTGASYIAAAAAADIAYELYKAGSIKLPRNEIIINVSLKKQGKIEYRSSNIYYVNDLDTDHYYFTKDRIGDDNQFNHKTFYTTD